MNTISSEQKFLLLSHLNNMEFLKEKAQHFEEWLVSCNEQSILQHIKLVWLALSTPPLMGNQKYRYDSLKYLHTCDIEF